MTFKLSREIKRTNLPLLVLFSACLLLLVLTSCTPVWYRNTMRNIFKLGKMEKQVTLLLMQQ